MKFLRIVGYVALVLMTLVTLSLIYVCFQNGDWKGVAIGVSGLVLFAFFGHVLWLEQYKRDRPHVTKMPSRAIMTALYFVLALGTLAECVDRARSGSWESAVFLLVLAVVMFNEAYLSIIR